MSEDSKDSHHHHHHFLPHHHHHHHEGDQPPPPPPEYGTFQAPSNYPPPQPVIGFPQPVPPPGVTASSPEYYAHGYQAVPAGYIAPDPEGRPEREHRLPCCGIGLGWFLFIIGFFFAGIPWYLGAFVLLCAQIDPREKPGYITCTIAAVLATFVLIFGLSKT